MIVTIPAAGGGIHIPDPTTVSLVICGKFNDNIALKGSVHYLTRVKSGINQLTGL
jgi:hypothetical protein